VKLQKFAIDGKVETESLLERNGTYLHICRNIITSALSPKTIIPSKKIMRELDR
jgi:hypothetical protein